MLLSARYRGERYVIEADPAPADMAAARQALEAAVGAGRAAVLDLEQTPPVMFRIDPASLTLGSASPPAAPVGSATTADDDTVGAGMVVAAVVALLVVFALLGVLLGRFRHR